MKTKNKRHRIWCSTRIYPRSTNIHLCNPFHFLEDLDIASCVEDTTIYIVKESKEAVINITATFHMVQ